MKPIVHGLEAQYSDRIGFVYLDIDDPTVNTFKQQLGFRVQPQFILLDGNGNIQKMWLGVISEKEFVTEFEKTLAK